LVNRPANCVKATTGGMAGAGGLMTVTVDTGSGQVQVASGSHSGNSVVVDRCYDAAIVSVQVRGEANDGWSGGITHSWDGGHTYSAMQCNDCTGTSWSADDIVVDGNNDGMGPDTWCHNGAACTLVATGFSPTTTTTSVYVLQAVYLNGGSSYLGHNGLAVGVFENVTTGTKWSLIGIGTTNCTLQAVAPMESGDSFLSSNGTGLYMVSAADTDNERWTIAGLC